MQLRCCAVIVFIFMLFFQSLYAANSRECKLLSHPWYSTSRSKGKSEEKIKYVFDDI